MKESHHAGVGLDGISPKIIGVTERNCGTNYRGLVDRHLHTCLT